MYNDGVGFADDLKLCFKLLTAFRRAYNSPKDNFSEG